MKKFIKKENLGECLRTYENGDILMESEGSLPYAYYKATPKGYRFQREFYRKAKAHQYNWCVRNDKLTPTKSDHPKPSDTRTTESNRIMERDRSADQPKSLEKTTNNNLVRIY
jgi:hypothetical protein